jgi:hypothetical protein
MTQREGETSLYGESYFLADHAGSGLFVSVLQWLIDSRLLEGLGITLEISGLRDKFVV